MWHPLPRYFYSPRYCLSLWHRSCFGSSWIEAGASVKLKAVYQPLGYTHSTSEAPVAGRAVHKQCSHSGILYVSTLRLANS